MSLLQIEESKKQKATQLLFFVILFLGGYLRFYQYFMGRSLWEDECHLALNLMKYGYMDLLKPLDYIQGAPILFLWAVKTFAHVFGYTELALRALPLLASLLTLPLFYYVLITLTKSRITSLIGFLIFSVNLALIYFSSELKPYAVDVSVYVLMIYLAISPNRFVAKRRILLLGVFGCLSIFLSLSVFIVLFIIGCNSILNWYLVKKIKPAEIKFMAPWLLAFVFNYYFFIHNHPSTEQQRINFDSGFCPTDLLSCEFVAFLRSTLTEIFYTLIFRISENYAFGFILFLLLVFGIAHLIKTKKYTLLLFTVLPILIHLGLSTLKIYPFVYRLILYLAPSFIILMAYGTNLLAGFLIRKIHYSIGLIFILFCCYSFNIESLKQFPLWFREIKPSLAFINDSLPGSQHVYVTDPIHAYMYYYDRGYVKRDYYRALPWYIDPPEFYDIVSNEQSNYAILYNPDNPLGYGDVIEDLKKKNLVVKHFEFKQYAVSVLKPLRTDSGKFVLNVDHTYFPKTLIFGEDKTIALWSSGPAVTSPVRLHKGKYSLSLITKGTSAGGIFPHLNFFMNDHKLGEFYTTNMYQNTDYTIDLDTDTSLVFKIQMDNDLVINKDDRNAFILRLKISERRAP